MKKILFLLSCNIPIVWANEAINNKFESNTNLPKEPQETETKQNSLFQIGSNFFESKGKFIIAHPISQIGGAFELRSNLFGSYVFFSQLLPSKIIYELRVTGIANYLAVPPRSQSTINIDDENQVLGYGYNAFIGYDIPINQRSTITPFGRFGYFHNGGASYQDIFGNFLFNDTYFGLAGLKISLLINDYFAVYSAISFGYQSTKFTGTGVFASNQSPYVNTLTSNIELGVPFRATDHWFFTPLLFALYRHALP